MNRTKNLALCFKNNESSSWGRRRFARFFISAYAGKLPAFPASVLYRLNTTCRAVTLGTLFIFITSLLTLSIFSLIPASAKGIANITNPNTFLDLQQAYGKKVQAKTKTNKQSTLSTKFLSKTTKTNKSNLFKSKSFYNSKAALKQFQVQFKVGNSYNVQQFGAKGDGVTDDQNAINQAITRATGTGLSVFFPPGNYLHSGLIVSNGVALYGAGTSTILTATNSANGAVELTGNGPSLSNLVVQYANPVPATSNFPDTTPQAGAVWVQSAANFTVSQVTILNSSENDIDVFQSTNGMVTNNQIAAIVTMNDGVQIADCDNVQVVSNNFPSAGNFAAIDVLYGGSFSQNLNISFNQIQPSGNYWYYGIFVTGLDSGQITHNSFSTNSYYGVILEGEPLGMFPGAGSVSNVIVSSNNLSSAGNYIEDETSDNSSINNVQFFNNVGYVGVQGGTNIMVISNTLTGGVGVDRGNNISIISNTITNVTGGEGIAIDGGSNIIVQNNQVGTATNGVSDNGISVFASSGDMGSLQISNNNLANCCTRGTANVINIQLSGGTISNLSIQSNYYAGPANNAQYYIQSLVPGSATNPNISGNTQATALPNNLSP